jgi:hypothetical protein
MRTRAGQGGWVGLIVLLLALAIVAVLGKTLLQQMGLVGASSGKAAVARPGSVQADVVVPAPAAALERARGVEQAVHEQARESAARIDRALSP